MSSRFCPNVPDFSDGYWRPQGALRQERGEGGESLVERVRKGVEVRLQGDTCRRNFRNVETGRPDATGLLNKADGKNRESENPEEISLLSGRNPTVALAIPVGALRNREFAERGEAAPSVCEYGRNDKTPKGLPHGVLR